MSTLLCPICGKHFGDGEHAIGARTVMSMRPVLRVRVSLWLTTICSSGISLSVWCGVIDSAKWTRVLVGKRRSSFSSVRKGALGAPGSRRPARHR